MAFWTGRITVSALRAYQSAVAYVNSNIYEGASLSFIRVELV